MAVSPGLETRELLSTVVAYPLRDVGSSPFVVSYCVNLERLSVQAHAAAGAASAAGASSVPLGRTAGGGGGDRGTVGGGGSFPSNGGSRGGNRPSGNESPGTPAAPGGLDGVLSALSPSGGGGGGEYVVDAFLEDDGRIRSMIRTLLALELWRTRVLFRDGGDGEEGGQCREKEEEEVVEFEVEGGSRLDEEYDSLNDVDGGEGPASGECNAAASSTPNANNNNGNAANGGETSFGGLAPRLAANGNVLRAAFVLHAETTVVSVLGLIFYRGVPPGLIEDDDGLLLSLIDYCARQLTFLGTPERSNPSLRRQRHPLPASELSSYVRSRTPLQELRDAAHDSAYRTAVASVSLSRYLAESAPELGPSLLGRMMETHDFPLLFVPLVEEPPWTRRRTVAAGRRGEGGDDSGAATETKAVWEKLHRGEWREVPPSELLNLTSHEGQPWLALYHLTCSSSCRSSYGLDEYRRSRLMRVRKFLRDGRLVDQLPVLSDVARYLDELSMTAVPPSGRGAVMGASSASSTGLLLERVDVVREGIAGGNAADRYASIAEGQWADIFSGVTDAEDGTLRRIAGEVYGGAEDGGGSDAWGPIGRASPSVSGEEKKDDGATPGGSDLGGEMGEDPHSHLPSGERWKIPLSGPVERVTLELLGEKCGGSTAHTFELVTSGRAHVTATPLGRYGRTKMTIARPDDGELGELGGPGAALPPNAGAVARIRFGRSAASPGGGDVELRTGSLGLPTSSRGGRPAPHDEVGVELAPGDAFPRRQWRQLGDLEGRTVVLQLGFERLPRGTVPAGETCVRAYGLTQAFFSQPML